MKEVRSSRNGFFFCFVLLLFSKLSEASGYKQKSPSNRYSFGSSEHWRGLFSICKYKELRSLWGEEQAGPLWPGRLISPALLLCRAGFLGHGPLCLSIKMPPGKSKRWTPDSVYLELKRHGMVPAKDHRQQRGPFHEARGVWAGLEPIGPRWPQHSQMEEVLTWRNCFLQREADGALGNHTEK